MTSGRPKTPSGLVAAGMTPLPPVYKPLTAGERAQLKLNPDQFWLTQRRRSWALTMAERHRLLPSKRSSLRSRSALAKHLLPELFPSDVVNARPGRYFADMDQVEVAKRRLGKLIPVRILVSTGRMTIEVEARNKDVAQAHVQSLGLKLYKQVKRPNRKR